MCVQCVLRRYGRHLSIGLEIRGTLYWLNSVVYRSFAGRWVMHESMHLEVVSIAFYNEDINQLPQYKGTQSTH